MSPCAGSRAGVTSTRAARSSGRSGRIRCSASSTRTRMCAKRSVIETYPLADATVAAPCSSGRRQVGQPAVFVHRVAVGHAGHVVADRGGGARRRRPPRRGRASRPAAGDGSACSRRNSSPVSRRALLVMRLTRQWRYMRAKRKSLIAWLASAMLGLKPTMRRFARRIASASRGARFGQAALRFGHHVADHARRSRGGSSRGAAAAAEHRGWTCGRRPGPRRPPAGGRCPRVPNRRARRPSSRSWLW